MSICQIAEQFVEPDPPIPRVLVIEDDAQVVQLMLRVLHPWNVQVGTADSFATAEVELESGPFNLVVLDLKIPGCNTSDMLRLVASKSECPVMVYSGNIEPSTMQAAIAILDRPVWFIEKPAMFNPERMERIFRLSNLSLKRRDHGRGAGNALNPPERRLS
jgi:DNA-binding NtrC family response regulator